MKACLFKSVILITTKKQYYSKLFKLSFTELRGLKLTTSLGGTSILFSIYRSALLSVTTPAGVYDRVVIGCYLCLTSLDALSGAGEFETVRVRAEHYVPCHIHDRACLRIHGLRTVISVCRESVLILIDRSVCRVISKPASSLLSSQLRVKGLDIKKLTFWSITFAN